VGFAPKKRLFAIFLALCVASLFVFLSASAVAWFTGRHEVVYCVCSACVVFYEVVCFGGWLSAPVAGWVAGE